jgi:hypothetical protein
LGQVWEGGSLVFMWARGHCEVDSGRRHGGEDRHGRGKRALAVDTHGHQFVTNVVYEPLKEGVEGLPVRAEGEELVALVTEVGEHMREGLVQFTESPRLLLVVTRSCGNADKTV